MSPDTTSLTFGIYLDADGTVSDVALEASASCFGPRPTSDFAFNRAVGEKFQTVLRMLIEAFAGLGFGASLNLRVYSTKYALPRCSAFTLRLSGVRNRGDKPTVLLVNENPKVCAAMHADFCAATSSPSFVPGKKAPAATWNELVKQFSSGRGSFRPAPSVKDGAK